MKWTTLTFGRHAGKSLPEIVIKDPDWFFWAIENRIFKGGLEFQADDIYRKARAIRIPKRCPSRWQVEYRYEDNGRFLGLQLVKVKDAGFQSPLNDRHPFLDLTHIRRCRTYDKRGCQNFYRDFRSLYFAECKKLTKHLIKSFFSDDRNFVRRELAENAGNQSHFLAPQLLSMPPNERREGHRGEGGVGNKATC